MQWRWADWRGAIRRHPSLHIRGRVSQAKPSPAAATVADYAAVMALHAGDALAGYHLKQLLNGAKGVGIQLE
jgi:hypothetical protein